MGFSRGKMMRSMTSADSDRPVIDGRWIPRPRPPVGPTLSAATFLDRGAGDRFAAITDVGPAAFVPAGRYAIAHALGLMGIGRDDEVLVPAFHCLSMVEPVLWVGARPVFYRLRDDLSVDLDDLSGKLTPRSRVLMVTHYFGFPQDVGNLRAFSDRNRLSLLEDCAHGFFGGRDGMPLGGGGDFAIASAMKFFPIPEGGCLVSARHPEAVRALAVRRQGLGASLRALLHAVEAAADRGRPSVLRPLIVAAEGAKWAVKAVAGRRRAANRPESDADASAESGVAVESPSFGARWMEVRATGFSRATARFASRSRICRKRRENYLRYLTGLGQIPGCRPLFDTLPEGVVPYMFPLWVDALADVFPVLEDRAVPMQRFGQFPWDGMDRATCPVGAACARHLVQFPCHQEMTGRDIDQVIARVRESLESTEAAVRPRP